MVEYYVSGCIDNGSEVETCDDSEATFWTLYERGDDGLSQGIIDCTFREDAEAAMRVYQERDALQQQVNALAAENLALKSINEDRRVFIMNGVQLGYIQVPDMETDPALETIRIAVSPQEITPATDAIKRQWMAEALSCVPSVCDGKEQKAFEYFAKWQRWDLQQHPLHYLFLDDKTNAARNSWVECLNYVASQLRQPEEKGQ